MLNLQLPPRATFVQIVEALLDATPSWSQQEKQQTLDRCVAAVARRARPKKNKDGDLVAGEQPCVGQVGEEDGGEEGEEDEDEDEERPDMSGVVVPDILQGLARCEVSD